MCQVEVNITQGFDSDEKRLPEKERESLTKSLNEFVHNAKNGLFPKKLFRRKGVVFPNDINKGDSSLYMLNATESLCVILAFDNDSLFQQKIITLFRVVNKSQAVEAFNSTASLIYN